MIQVGVSVSAAVMILFSGFILSASIFFTSFDQTISNVIESSNKSLENENERIHTSVHIENATYNVSYETLTVNVLNAGSTELETKKCQVIIDGVLRTQRVDWNSTVVDGIPSNVWAPKTVLSVQIPQPNYPSLDYPQRVKVVTGNGISDYSADIYISP